MNKFDGQLSESLFKRGLANRQQCHLACIPDAFTALVHGDPGDELISLSVPVAPMSPDGPMSCFYGQNVDLLNAASTMWPTAPALVTSTLRSLRFTSLTSTMPEGKS